MDTSLSCRQRRVSTETVKLFKEMSEAPVDTSLAFMVVSSARRETWTCMLCRMK